MTIKVAKVSAVDEDSGSVTVIRDEQACGWWGGYLPFFWRQRVAEPAYPQIGESHEKICID